jgi:hypothetical protein
MMQFIVPLTWLKSFYLELPKMAAGHNPVATNLAASDYL